MELALQKIKGSREEKESVERGIRAAVHEFVLKYDTLCRDKE